MDPNRPAPPNPAPPPDWQQPRGPYVAPEPTRSLPPANQARSRFWDFVFFRRMITPGLMTVLWVLGVIGITIWAVVVLITFWNGTYYWWTFADQFLASVFLLLAWLLGNVYLRVILELIAVLFRIYERLTNIDKRGRGM